jgi:monofunctional biosynthetic peptidoglycan transglycosylase
MVLLFLVWLFGVWPPPVWWQDHWPRETAMMQDAAGRQGRRVGGQAGSSSLPNRPTIRPTPLTDISPLLQRMVVIGEDSRFWSHHGIDPVEMADAMRIDRSRGAAALLRTVWRRRDRMRGASTITQQLAKNLYLSPSRSLLRKVKEAVTALRLDLALPKKRILELYLNVAEWGPGIWGAQAASRAYFGVPASQLDERAAAALAATLPHPRTSNPRFRPERTLTRRDLILARFHGVDVYVPPELEEIDSLQNGAPVIEPAVDSLEVGSPPESGANDTLERDTLSGEGNSFP